MDQRLYIKTEMLNLMEEKFGKTVKDRRKQRCSKQSSSCNKK